MGINFKSFIKDIKRGANKAKQNIASYNKENIKGLVKDVKGAYTAKKNLKATQELALKKLIEKHVPSKTVIGYRKHARRKKEYGEMIANGNVKAAFDLAKKRKKEFDILNK